MRIFITGTGTNVGKTVVSAWLCQQLRADYYKPVQTGVPTDSDWIAEQLPLATIWPSAYAFPTPCSPDFAAHCAGTTIELNQIHFPSAPSLITEGAGGIMVPLNKSEYMIDLIAQSQMPVVLVTDGQLGTINHTLLSVQAIRSRQIPLLGLVINEPSAYNNTQTLLEHTGLALIAQLPRVHNLRQIIYEFPLDTAHLEALYTNAKRP